MNEYKLNNNKAVETPAQTIGIYSTIMIAVGYAITINNFTVGANIGAGLPLFQGLGAIFLTWLALSLVWCLSGLMGQISKKSAATIFKYVFGTSGSKVPSFCIAMTNWLWAMFDYWYVGSVVKNMLPSHPHLGFAIGMVVIISAVIIGIFKDISSLKWLTGLTVPVAVALFIAIMIAVINRTGFETFLTYKPTAEMPVVLAINTMFASFISVCGAFSDITKNARNKKCVLIAMPIGMAFVCFQFIVAQFGAIGLACVDLTSLALSLGGAIFYLINFFIIVGQSTTAPSSSFVIVTQMVETFHIPRKLMIFLQPLTAGCLSFVVEYAADITVLNKALTVVAIMFGPLLSILFCDFYLVYKTKLGGTEPLPEYSACSFTSLGVGLLLGIYLTYFCPVATPVSLLSFVAAFILQYLLRKYSRLS